MKRKRLWLSPLLAMVCCASWAAAGDDRSPHPIGFPVADLPSATVPRISQSALHFTIQRARLQGGGGGISTGLASYLWRMRTQANVAHRVSRMRDQADVSRYIWKMRTLEQTLIESILARASMPTLCHPCGPISRSPATRLPSWVRPLMGAGPVLADVGLLQERMKLMIPEISKIGPW